MQWFDLAGYLGVALIVGGYFLLQSERWQSSSTRYALANAAGAALIGFSLLFDFNWPSFVIECFWFVISLYGLVRNLRMARSWRWQEMRIVPVHPSRKIVVGRRHAPGIASGRHAVAQVAQPAAGFGGLVHQQHILAQLAGVVRQVSQGQSGAYQNPPSACRRCESGSCAAADRHASHLVDKPVIALASPHDRTDRCLAAFAQCAITAIRSPIQSSWPGIGPAGTASGPIDRLKIMHLMWSTIKKHWFTA